MIPEASLGPHCHKQYIGGKQSTTSTIGSGSPGSTRGSTILGNPLPFSSVIYTISATRQDWFITDQPLLSNHPPQINCGQPSWALFIATPSRRCIKHRGSTVVEQLSTPGQLWAIVATNKYRMREINKHPSNQTHNITFACT